MDVYTPDAGRRDLEEWREDQPSSYAEDPFFDALCRRHLGEIDERINATGRTAVDPVGRLTEIAERRENLPRVERCDAFGRPTERVLFHPASEALKELWWRTGVLEVLEAPDAEVLSGALAWLMDHNGEAGHACPVACTAGAIRLIQRVGSEDQKTRWLPRLLDPQEGLRASQFVTEVQGGSDVGSNVATATADPDAPGGWRISGEKWFCSVADAGLFVVSARPDGGAEGTRGLGLFLVPREIDGAPNGFELRRLKDKLGTRGMATGEIVFTEAAAEAIGAVDEGFANLVSVILDTSRVHNALSAAAAANRAWILAASYAVHRKAFGVRLADLPPVRQLTARARRRAMAATASTFRILAASDRLARGEGGERLRAARRIDVMINKYWTALAATAAVHDAIEVLGGNGTMEDFSPLPRLYRDCMVMESWEGPHNTLCAQVLRDFQTRGLHQPWLEQITVEVAELGSQTLTEELARVQEQIERVVGSEPVPAAAGIRSVVDAMAGLVDLLVLEAQAAWEGERDLDSGAAAAAELYRRLDLGGEDRLTASGLAAAERRLSRWPW